MHRFPSRGRLSRPRHRGAQAGAPRFILFLPLLGLLAAAMLLLPSLASADTSSTLSVVGTSDVSDSGLMPNVIMPEFEKAYPQFIFKYTGSASGAAIQNARNGTGASALIVHAASLENQFVADGYSYDNRDGNAIFNNDFVLAGPKGDPAGVAANGAHNIAQAFADVATAGAAGKDTFYTRGGTTTASGTTVQEHAIWALVYQSHLAPSTLVLCSVSSLDGGGMSPIKSSKQSTSGQACPDSGTVSGTDVPSWYFVNAMSTQAANVIATNACTQGTSGANTCYVLTDRGTYDYLSSGTSPSAGTVGIPNLTVATSDNAAAAPGGANELTNYFHVYIINPSKPGQSVNLSAAQDFVNFLTSPTFQGQLKSYLPNSLGGPPFTADASPIITTTKKLPTTYKAGKKWTVVGTVTNAQPGYPAPSGKPISVDKIVGGLPVPVATGKTSSTGAFKISYVPPSSGSYELTTPQISQIEIPSLNPQYGDILSPAATAPVKTTVHSAVTSLRVKSQGGKALVFGTVSPGTGHVKASVTVYDRQGTKGKFKKVATDRLSTGDANFAVLVKASAGKWQFKVSFKDPKAVIGTTSKTVKATVGIPPPTSVALRSVKVRKGALTVTGSVAPPASVHQPKVELLGLRTSGTSARFTELAKVALKDGQTRFTLHARLRRGYRWVLQLERTKLGQPAGYSGLKTLNVK